MHTQHRLESLHLPIHIILRILTDEILSGVVDAPPRYQSAVGDAKRRGQQRFKNILGARMHRYQEKDLGRPKTGGGCPGPLFGDCRAVDDNGYAQDLGFLAEIWVGIRLWDADPGCKA